MAPRATQNARHTWEVNWGPLSETISVGMPCRRNTLFDQEVCGLS